MLGIISTADLEDATPAATAVHTGNRNSGTGIIDQFLDESDLADTGESGTGLRVLMGGGRRWFLPASQFGSSRAVANDYPEAPADLAEAWGLHPDADGALDPDATSRRIVDAASLRGRSTAVGLMSSADAGAVARPVRLRQHDVR